MSNTSHINNSIYQFEIALVNTKTKAEMYLPIPKGAVEYLEIEDTLANLGLVGKCKIANFYGILQHLKVLDVDGVNCMYINIQNCDFDKISTDPSIALSLLAILSKNTETSTNSVDKALNFELEEYFIGRLKMESILDSLKELPTEETPGKFISKLLEYSNKESIPTPTMTNGFDKLFLLEGEAPFKVKLADIYDGNTVKSTFDLVQELYRYVSYTTEGPAILAMANVDSQGIIKRKFTLQPLATYTSGFYEKYQQGETDLSKFVTEEFNIGDSASASTLNTNFIDSYDFVRSDQTDVLSEKWIDYVISSFANFDLTNTDISKVLYSDVRSAFSAQILKGITANLPERDPDRNGSEKINVKVIHKKLSDKDDVLTKVYIENTLKKSFIFDNTALTFSVPGNTYRRAGKFIKINSLDFNEVSSVKEVKPVDGYWFIISVKHIFKNDIYTNEYVCVRLHGSGLASLGQPTFANLSDNLKTNIQSNNPLTNVIGGSTKDNPTSPDSSDPSATPSIFTEAPPWNPFTK